MLNSLFGRLALKESENELKFMDNIDQDELDLIYTKADILYEKEDIKLVKFYGEILRDFLTLIEKKSKINKPNKYKKKITDMKYLGWGKNISAVQISSAIAAYSRMYMTQFKNLSNNKIVQVDTDFVTVTKHLEDKFIINYELGGLKEESKIKELLISDRKFYLAVTSDDRVIIKASGVKNAGKVLNYSSFVKLFRGEDIVVPQIKFEKKNLVV